jgi:hypothetical protein
MPRAVAQVSSARKSSRWPAAIFGASVAVLSAGLPEIARAENADISLRRASERTTFSNDDIRDGFFKTAFHAELQFDRPAERIRKFDGPVRIYIVNRGTPDRSADIASVVADIRARVDHLDLAITANRADANVVLMLVQTREFAQTIRSRYGEKQARRIEQTLKPECLSGIGKDPSFHIRRAEIILPTDVSDFRFYDCAYEEVLQSLGLVNDDGSVPWTMFNDDVEMGFFDRYDQYLVNLLYDPRVRAGMTREEVSKIFPDVLLTVRAWVAKANLPKADLRNTSAPEDRPNLKRP